MTDDIMDRIAGKMEKCGVVPVIQIEDAEQAPYLAEALTEGGLPCAEITFRTPCAADAIYKMTRAFPEMLIGAGTVLTSEQADRAADAGASFIVSPGFNDRHVEYCLGRGYKMIPGTCTPGEIEKALSFGLKYLKFFPAEAAGGIKMLSAAAAPYKGVRFMPTGGINEDNMSAYLEKPFVFCCGGTFIAGSKDISERNFGKIKETALRVSQAVKQNTEKRE